MAHTVHINVDDHLLNLLDKTIARMTLDDHPVAKAHGGHWGRAAFVREAVRAYIGPAAKRQPKAPKTLSEPEWVAQVDVWRKQRTSRRPFTTTEALAVVGVDDPIRHDEMKMGEVLRHLGLNRRRTMINGVRAWRWE